MSHPLTHSLTVVLPSGPFEPLQTLKRLRILKLDYCSIRADGASAVAAAVRASTTLEVLSLQGNQLMPGGGTGGSFSFGGGGFGMANSSTGGVEALANAFPTCAVLASVNLSGTGLGPQGAALLAPALPFCASMASVDVSNCALGPKGAGVLATAITGESITNVNVLGNAIGEEGYHMLSSVAEAKGIGTLCGLNNGQTEADLSNQTLGPIDAKLVAWDLRAGFVSASLTILSLRNNYIGSEGAVAVAKSLEVNASLTSIDLSENYLQKDGAVALPHLSGS